jgi:hypothetical protein
VRYLSYPIFNQHPIHYPNPVTGLAPQMPGVQEGRRPEPIVAGDEKK